VRQAHRQGRDKTTGNRRGQTGQLTHRRPLGALPRELRSSMSSGSLWPSAAAARIARLPSRLVCLGRTDGIWPVP
jgi:hypothetical protein